MTCEGFGQTIKDGKMVYFCTAVALGDRKYFHKKERVTCPVGAICLAKKKALAAREASSHEINYKSRLAGAPTLPLIRGVFTAAKNKGNPH